MSSPSTCTGIHWWQGHFSTLTTSQSQPLLYNPYWIHLTSKNPLEGSLAWGIHAWYPQRWHFHILEYTFSGTTPWTFPAISICLSVASLVKDHHHPQELRSSGMDHLRTRTSAVSVYTKGYKSDEGSFHLIRGPLVPSPRRHHLHSRAGSHCLSSYSHSLRHGKFLHNILRLP